MSKKVNKDIDMSKQLERYTNIEFTPAARAKRYVRGMRIVELRDPIRENGKQMSYLNISLSLVEEGYEFITPQRVSDIYHDFKRKLEEQSK